MICTAEGNLEDYAYGWEYKSENESDIVREPLLAFMRQDKRSYLTLGDVPQKRIYVCHANNTVGQGSKCEIIVEGKIFKFIFMRYLKHCKQSCFFDKLKFELKISTIFYKISTIFCKIFPKIQNF